MSCSRWLFVATILLAAGIGCSSAPTRVTAPPISPTAGADAIKKLDKNGDGGLDDAELVGAPGLKETGAKKRFDANSDGKITADEITARVQLWADRKIGLTQYALTIKMDGQPLKDATVTLVPEDWLGTEIKGGVGTTDASGRANIAIPPADLKPDEAGLLGMRLGVYKVQVTHPMIMIPAKFNTATEIGVEVAPDEDPGRLPEITITR